MLAVMVVVSRNATIVLRTSVLLTTVEGRLAIYRTTPSSGELAVA